MKRYITFLGLAALVSGCASSGGSNGGELVGVGGTAWGEPSPYGMVLIKRGSFEMGHAEGDSLWGTTSNARSISVDAFWMDDTEITNSEYKQFVFWVRDSIIRERLADPAYGGNEAFKIEEDRHGNPVTPHLNWSKSIPWRNPNEDEARAIESLYRIDPITGKKGLDYTQLNYRYDVYDYTEAAKRKNRMDPSRRILNTDITPGNEEILISKDTAFINDDGQIVTQTIIRPRQNDFDFLNTYIVNIYPDTTVWINDFNNAYNEPYMRMYFSHPGYNDYPVVGVSWEQANAFCVWRTNLLSASMTVDRIVEPYRLPTEAEWEYAARAGKNENSYPWKDEGMADKGCFYANFKPMKGNYLQDGNLITSRVAIYPPNEFGLYDMAGNVSEWTSTAYTEAVDQFTSDMNPDYRYNAAKEDPYRMKRKIVRGGSWKDVSNFVRSDIRMWEYQNEQRSYIGFRCVRTQVGFTKGRKN
ncbi:MAG: SUMF1/EgtB/PvdO family nonheme iron enzyme [Porphyromonadaceae bacterium]|nr:SUMF1/EgtB/PvdO family nonheme iron enzyme [Porphyromonadaceae bacterium]